MSEICFHMLVADFVFAVYVYLTLRCRKKCETSFKAVANLKWNRKWHQQFGRGSHLCLKSVSKLLSRILCPLLSLPHNKLPKEVSNGFQGECELKIESAMASKVPPRFLSVSEICFQMVFADCVLRIHVSMDSGPVVSPRSCWAQLYLRIDSSRKCNSA